MADNIHAPLAAGENFSFAAEFNTRHTLDASPSCSRTWENGGRVGLLTSLHVKAAAGGRGFVEVDVNANPLRSAISSPVLRSLSAGRVHLLGTPGIGDVEVLLEQFSSRRTMKLECAM